MKIQLLLLALLVTTTASAQLTLSGSVMDTDSAPLPYTNVLLLRAADSSFVQGGLTDNSGLFTLQAPAGNYLVSVSALGYTTYFGQPFTLKTDQELPPIRLGNGGVDLSEITVTAQQPLLVRQIDRTVINVADQPTTAGLSALEVLERSPGVFINRQNGAISMAGKDGVNVLINGRANYIDASGLADFLAGLSADNIQKIELITTPPANFDAQGNAGFINIVLKELPDEGLNGNYNATVGYGRSNLTGRAGVNVNYRKNGLALVAAYDFSQPSLDQQTLLSRTDFTTGLRTDLVSERDPLRFVHNARLGADYELSDKTTIGAVVAGYDNRWEMPAVSTTRFSPLMGSDTVVVSDNFETNDWRHLRLNANLRHRLAGGCGTAGGGRGADSELIFAKSCLFLCGGRFRTEENGGTERNGVTPLRIPPHLRLSPYETKKGKHESKFCNTSAFRASKPQTNQLRTNGNQKITHP